MGLGTDASTCRCQQAVVVPPQHCQQFGKCPPGGPAQLSHGSGLEPTSWSAVLVDTQDIELYHLCVTDMDVCWDVADEPNRFPI